MTTSVGTPLTKAERLELDQLRAYQARVHSWVAGRGDLRRLLRQRVDDGDQRAADFRRGQLYQLDRLAGCLEPAEPLRHAA